MFHLPSLFYLLHVVEEDSIPKMVGHRVALQGSGKVLEEESKLYGYKLDGGRQCFQQREGQHSLRRADWQQNWNVQFCQSSALLQLQKQRG